ncbi:Thymidylate synthase [Habropoda laboriosa]|uniref:Thymidylate synthase n=1 Tax=Habropoda laboriosa TaxID=597456 RepID=A0A0L7QJ28_9HYME|nr:Thymidylate synthase [Habropoda laboriosa]
MRSYLDILKSIRQHGELIEGRNGFTISSFGERFRHDLRKGFPLLTVKQVPKRAPLAEMFAFLRGETNNQGFEDLGCKVWQSKGVSTTRKKITNEKGDLGPIYGQQWRHWKTTKGIEIDQIKYVIDELTTDPHSPLPPCHLMTIFKTTGQGRVLNLHQIMRSCDVPIGLPFNIAGYAYLLKIMAKQLKMEAGEMIIDITDAHIYEKNKSEVSEMLSRDPMELCELTIPDGIDITDKSTLTNENIDRILENVQGYKSHPKIKMEVSV